MASTTAVASGFTTTALAAASPANWARAMPRSQVVSACPLCSAIVESFGTLRTINSNHYHCHFCQNDYDATLDDYAQVLGGLVLQGGSDVWPGSYGETPLEERWAGDRVRDQYELALLRAFTRAGKPVLGVCRGLQLLNVAYGGTLYQDIARQRPEALLHRDAARYDRHLHEVEFLPGSRLAAQGPRTGFYTG